MSTGNSGDSRTRRGLLAVIALAMAFISAPSQALVLLDTYAPGNGTPGKSYLLNNTGGIGQSLAVPFTTTGVVTVDSILAAISGSGSVTLGIMADAGGVPSNLYLHSTVLTDPAANVLLTGLGWTLTLGDYWLAAIGVDAYDGHWFGGDADTDFAFTRDDGPVTDWIHFTTELPNFEAPAARISTGDAPLPEPLTIALIGTGLLGLGLRRGRAG